jgi:hypothetical protein
MTSPDPLNKKTGVGRLPIPVFFKKMPRVKAKAAGHNTIRQQGETFSEKTPKRRAFH